MDMCAGAYVGVYLCICICMCNHAHAYIHTCMPTYIHACLLTSMLTYIHTYIRTYIHTYTHIHTRTYIYICIHTSVVYAHADAHIHVCIYTCLYVHNYFIKLGASESHQLGASRHRHHKNFAAGHRCRTCRNLKIRKAYLDAWAARGFVWQLETEAWQPWNLRLYPVVAF